MQATGLYNLNGMKRTKYIKRSKDGEVLFTVSQEWVDWYLAGDHTKAGLIPIEEDSDDNGERRASPVPEGRVV